MPQQLADGVEKECLNRCSSYSKYWSLGSIKDDGNGWWSSSLSMQPCTFGKHFSAVKLCAILEKFDIFIQTNKTKTKTNTLIILLIYANYIFRGDYLSHPRQFSIAYLKHLDIYIQDKPSL